MTECYIGIGKCTHFHIFILSFIFFSTLKDLVLYYSNILNRSYIMQSLSRYFSFFIFGIILFIIFKINNNNNNKTNQNILITNNPVENNNSKEAHLIFNDNKNKLVISNKAGLIFFVICLIYVLYYEILQLIDFFELNPLDLRTIDIIFVLIFMHIYYPQNIYKHQIYSMIFVVIINTILLIEASICKIYKNNSKNIYEYKGKNICIYGIIIYIDIIFLIYFSRMKAKEIMDKQFISPYKIIILIGIIGFVLQIILSLIVSFLGVNKKCHNENNINIYCYFKINIKDYFSEYSQLKDGLEIFKEIIFLILFIISSFISIMSELFIIKYLNPSYILISENIYFEIIKLNEYLPGNKESESSKNFIFLQIAQFFEFIGCLIYLEIIELRFCGLNKNIKKNISKRSEQDKFNEMSVDSRSVSSKGSKASFNSNNYSIELK